MVGITMTGGAQLEQALNALEDAVRKDVLVEALMQAGEPIRAQMAQMAPRGDDAPHIADNISMSALKSFEGVRVSETEAAIAIGPAKGYFYGFFWEFGWSKHPAAHPFVRPAFDGGVAKALASIGTFLWGAIARAVSSRSSGGGNV